MNDTGQLTFDVQQHRHFYEGRELLGVTSVLKAVGLISTDWFSDEAARRGTCVHAAAEAIDRGTFQPATLDPSLVGYIRAYERFLAECRVGPCVLIEEQLADPVLGYAGIVDRVRLVRDRLSLIDLKTGGEARWHGYQLAAYEAMARLRLGCVLPRYGLYLQVDGTYRVRQYADRTDWTIFRAALLVAQAQRLA